MCQCLCWQLLSQSVLVRAAQSCSLWCQERGETSLSGTERRETEYFSLSQSFLPPAKGGGVFSACYRSIFCSRYSTFLNVQFSNFLMFLCQKICILNSEGSCATVCKQLRGQLSLILILKYMEFNGEGKGTKLMLGFFLFPFFPPVFLAVSPTVFKYM